MSDCAPSPVVPMAPGGAAKLSQSSAAGRANTPARLTDLASQSQALPK